MTGKNLKKGRKPSRRQQEKPRSKETPPSIREARRRMVGIISRTTSKEVDEERAREEKTILQTPKKEGLAGENNLN